MKIKNVGFGTAVFLTIGYLFLGITTEDSVWFIAFGINVLMMLISLAIALNKAKEEYDREMNYFTNDELEELLRTIKEEDIDETHNELLSNSLTEENTKEETKENLDLDANDELYDIKIVKRCIDILKNARESGNVEQLDFVENNLFSFNMFDVCIGDETKALGTYVWEIINKYYGKGGLKNVFFEMPNIIDMMLFFEHSIIDAFNRK